MTWAPRFHPDTRRRDAHCGSAKPTYKNINYPSFSLVLDLLKERQKFQAVPDQSQGIKAPLNLNQPFSQLISEEKKSK